MSNTVSQWMERQLINYKTNALSRKPAWSPSDTGSPAIEKSEEAASNDASIEYLLRELLQWESPSGRREFARENEERITAHSRTLSEKIGNQAGAYQAALKDLYESLSEEERLNYERAAQLQSKDIGRLVVCIGSVCFL